MSRTERIDVEIPVNRAAWESDRPAVADYLENAARSIMQAKYPEQTINAVTVVDMQDESLARHGSSQDIAYARLIRAQVDVTIIDRETER